MRKVSRFRFGNHLVLPNHVFGILVGKEKKRNETLKTQRPYYDVIVLVHKLQLRGSLHHGPWSPKSPVKYVIGL